MKSLGKFWSKIPITEIAKARTNVLLFIHAVIETGSDYPHARMITKHLVKALRDRHKIDENDAFRLHAHVPQLLDADRGWSTRRKHRV